MRTIFSLAIAALVYMSPAALPSIAGEWNASYSTPGGTTAFKIVFVVDGEKLTGTVKRASGDVPLSGAVKGDSARFVYTIQYNDHPLDMTVSAKVTGDDMKGIVDFGGNAQEVFQAKRASAPGKP